MVTFLTFLLEIMGIVFVLSRVFREDRFLF